MVLRAGRLTIHFAYIGALTGGDFDWEKGSPGLTSNMPPRLVPREKGRNLGVALQWVWDQMRSGTYEGKQLDWGAWGLKMTGAQLRGALGTTALEELLDSEVYVLVAGEVV